MSTPPYCNSLSKYSRLKTRVVNIGNTPVGGEHPIRVQSMTTTDTMDVEATVEQSIRMIDAGCEYVRITAPSIKEAKKLADIKSKLSKRGYNTPLVADIHFTPNAAEIAAGIVEKVRVNPGNYADKKKFETIDYTDESYEIELKRIRERFTPLIKLCKENNVAMRIGTNHGSLSDRILSRYGDTPLGMVESAMEFIQICEDNDYFDIVLSMKASNAQVMVQAYRMLTKTMLKKGMNYPLHLGVTEAGEGEDGRIKSAIGIGALLEDGIGDTIRVSLTEEPEYEIPVAQTLVNRYNNRQNHSLIKGIQADQLPYDPFQYKKRESKAVLNIGYKNVPRVVADLSNEEEIDLQILEAVGYIYQEKLDKWKINDLACDYIFVGNKTIDISLPGTLKVICQASNWVDQPNTFPLFDLKSYQTANNKSSKLNIVTVEASDILDNKLDIDNSVVLVFETANTHGMAEQRRMFIETELNHITNPVIIKRNYNNLSVDEFQLFSAADMGPLLLDGFGDGIWIQQQNCTSVKKVNETAFGILQGTRTRISKTEYISCPSCGRTLFDLQETTQKIRARTDHLKGVKIGIMGCIVNGPGEMADADYGYVGTGVGKITLYKGQEVVEKNVPEDKAVDALINLIRDNGDWVEND